MVTTYIRDRDNISRIQQYCCWWYVLVRRLGTRIATSNVLDKKRWTCTSYQSECEPKNESVLIAFLQMCQLWVRLIEWLIFNVASCVPRRAGWFYTCVDYVSNLHIYMVPGTWYSVLVCEIELECDVLTRTVFLVDYYRVPGIWQWGPGVKKRQFDVQARNITSSGAPITSYVS